MFLVSSFASRGRYRKRAFLSLSHTMTAVDFGDNMKRLIRGGKVLPQLCLVFQGLRGSGKSTLSRILTSILEAQRIDADILAGDRGAQTEGGWALLQKVVLGELNSVSVDDGKANYSVLVIDSLAISAAGRKGLLQAVAEKNLTSTKAVMMLLVQMEYPGSRNTLHSQRELSEDEELRLCCNRILSRGGNHQDPPASEYDATTVLKVALANRRDLEDWELRLFHGVYKVNMTDPAHIAAVDLLRNLHYDGWVDLSLQIASLETLAVDALQESQRIEVQIGGVEFNTTEVDWRLIAQAPLQHENKMDIDHEWSKVLSANLIQSSEKLGCTEEIFATSFAERFIKLCMQKNLSRISFKNWIQNGTIEDAADKAADVAFTAIFEKFKDEFQNQSYGTEVDLDVLNQFRLEVSQKLGCKPESQETVDENILQRFGELCAEYGLCKKHFLQWIKKAKDADADADADAADAAFTLIIEDLRMFLPIATD